MIVNFGESCPCENSPALQRWVCADEYEQVPSGTTDGVLSSLTGLARFLSRDPSAEALGYFRKETECSLSFQKRYETSADVLGFPLRTSRVSV